MPSRPTISSAFEHERRVSLFGSHVRLLIGDPVLEGLPSPDAMGIQIEFFLRLLQRRLSRFDPGSDLSALNADPRPHVMASSTLTVAIEAALWAARLSDGLVDPTLAVGVLISAEMASGNDPALGPKATATAKKSTATPAGSASSSSPSAGSGNDPYTQQYGSGYSYGSGSSGYSSSPAPVTSGTS